MDVCSGLDGVDVVFTVFRSGAAFFSCLKKTGGLGSHRFGFVVDTEEEDVFDFTRIGMREKYVHRWLSDADVEEGLEGWRTGGVGIDIPLVLLFAEDETGGRGREGLGGRGKAAGEMRRDERRIRGWDCG